jgi:hypothetical protein
VVAGVGRVATIHLTGSGVTAEDRPSDIFCVGAPVDCCHCLTVRYYIYIYIEYL